MMLLLQLLSCGFDACPAPEDRFHPDLLPDQQFDL